MFLNILLLLILLLLLIIYYLFFYKKDEVYYIENFLTEEEYNYIKKYTKNIKNLKSENFRLIKPILDKRINNIFYSQKYIEKINNIVNSDLKESEFPIEFRVYPEGSQGMNCHKDTLLYVEPQYEIIYTIENESDSYTNWYSNLGWNNKIYTKPNSLIIVKAQGNLHCVSPVNKGYRTILKLIYTKTDKYNNNYIKEMNRFKFEKIN
jgi:hypothetical protein